MTTETIKTRSATAAQKIADERGLAQGTYTITKIATAKYELVITIADEPAPAEKPAKAPKATKVNRHWNDDGSLTIYVGGVKVRRFGGEDNEEASEEELEDTEAFVEKYLGRRFPKKTGGWVWGRTTQGHNWHTKRAKKLRADIEAGREAGQDVSELEAQLARLTGRGA